MPESKYYSIFLDDIRSPLQVTWVDLPLCEWTVVRSYTEFVGTITKRGIPARVTFDHDLSLEHYPLSEADGGISNPTTIPYGTYKEKTGYDCAKWLAGYCASQKKHFPESYVHSFNPIGKQNIIKLIKDIRKQEQ